MRAITTIAPLVVVAVVAIGCREAPDTSATDEAAAPPEAEPATEQVGAAAAVAEETPRMTADQLAEIFAGSEVFLLDVRRPEELEELGTVEGYTNIPIGELADRLDELPRDRPILTA